jgi:hypothetical protein
MKIIIILHKIKNSVKVILLKEKINQDKDKEQKK